MATAPLVSPHELDNQGLLYKPERPQHTRTFQLLNLVNHKYSLRLNSYHDLYHWSITQIDAFWSTIWDETEIIGHKGAHAVDNSALPAENPPWFVDAKLNWAENMLRCRSPDKIALIQTTEPTSADPDPSLRQVTYAELYHIVADLVSALLSLGLKAGDRVASYSSNCIENVAACLAATAIGCVWVSAAADFGPEGVYERFEQVRPSVVFAVDGVVYNGRVHAHLPKLSSLLASLRAEDIKPKVVVINAVSNTGDRTAWQDEWISWSDFVDDGRTRKLGRDKDGEIEWRRQSFDWPLWILFSSGTTGRPKPIVHRAGGMLLQAKKEFVICADLKAEDVFFYYTTTGWMMWNFLVAGLSVGCTLVLYDGSPLRDPAYLWRLTDELGITIFGTSAKYLDQLSKVYRPKEHHKLDALRHIYSTGSPLAPPLFDFVYQSIKKDVLLASITGGTDICSLFAGMCTALPVYRGEIQCRMLGMAIEAYTPVGVAAGPDVAGDLVCLRPFPCMPIGFWPLAGFGQEAAVEAAKVRYQQAYFSEFKGIWYHGDHVVVTRSKMGNGGGLIMLGRSDGVLNPGGVRFGSAELYDVLDMCFSGSATAASETIIDYLAVGQALDGGADERVILFVKLMDGERMSADLEKRIKSEIRARRTARHVPARIIQVTDIPYTLNGKRVEVPVKKIINGAAVSSINPATLRNPECLDEYVRLGEQLRGEVS
ncbi:acetoacetyl-CoA synthetase [Heliocybe sulcata]|uniref:Acetoacetyl-CoA synthetase n=1 Tax=Heliocybe sulcata TaxID=5364 RepID=A0A5C3NGV1_9AGAM|nr:acetoacetyl-CoA synthetase [Heliocybe sulcata]